MGSNPILSAIVLSAIVESPILNSLRPCLAIVAFNARTMKIAGCLKQDSKLPPSLIPVEAVLGKDRVQTKS
jgi:hypothetical protein